MTDRTEPLNDVINVLKAGADFYKEAADAVEDDALKTIFTEMARKRVVAVVSLSQRIESLGKEPAEAGWAETAMAWYGEMRGKIGDDATFIAQLEEHEDRTLDTIRSAMEDAASSPEHAMLAEHLKTFRETHDEMKALKEKRAA